MEKELLDAIHNLEKRFEVFEAKTTKDHEFLRELLTAQSQRDEKLKERIETNANEIESLNLRMARKDAEFQTTLRNRSLVGGLIVGGIAILELCAILWAIFK